MKIKLIGNKKASETIKRLKEVGTRDFGITWTEDNYENVLNYGVSDFCFSKSEQAELFEDIIENTIINEEEILENDNLSFPDDYTLVVMKNPTRVMLWKDAKSIEGTKYLYIKNKEEWRINYSFGKVRSVLNKNVADNFFGKASITQWTVENNPTVREVLIKLTKDIAKEVQEISNLKSFGLDIIKDKNSDTYYFLELNQANSLNESDCKFFLQGYMDSIKEEQGKKEIAEIATFLLNELTEEQIKNLILKLKVE